MLAYKGGSAAGAPSLHRLVPLWRVLSTAKHQFLSVLLLSAGLRDGALLAPALAFNSCTKLAGTTLTVVAPPNPFNCAQACATTPCWRPLWSPLESARFTALCGWARWGPPCGASGRGARAASLLRRRVQFCTRLLFDVLAIWLLWREGSVTAAEASSIGAVHGCCRSTVCLLAAAAAGHCLDQM